MSGDWRTALEELSRAIEADEMVTVKTIVGNLTSATEIARRYGYTQQALSMMRRRASDFPEPVRTFGQVHVFWRPHVEDWMTAHQRRPLLVDVRND